MSIFSLRFLVFIVALLIMYFWIVKKYQRQCLLVASYAFYFLVGGYKSAIFILFTTTIVFLGARHIEKTEKKKGTLILVLLVNIGILIALKYGKFLIEIFNYSGDFFTRFGLPLGISFYTFQAAGYLIDVYRGRQRAEEKFLKFALFISFFSQILQGPISRFGELGEQLASQHEFDPDRFKFGAERMLWGYFKKLVVADRIAPLVVNVYENYEAEGYVGFIIIIGVTLFGVQMYADFSGGMDIVIGLSEVLGIRLPENFRQPFFSKDVAEFWRRWHITLGTWMKDYVFYPFALSKFSSRIGKKLRQSGKVKAAKLIPGCIASFLVFILVGIWHGSGWNYVLYGIYHGLFIAVGPIFEGVYSKAKNVIGITNENRVFKVFQMVRTFIIMVFGWYFAGSMSAQSSFGMIRATFGAFNPSVIKDGTLLTLGVSGKNILVFLIALSAIVVVDVLHEKGYHIRELIESQRFPIRLVVYLAGIFSIVIFGVYGYGVSQAGFIYQGF